MVGACCPGPGARAAAREHRHQEGHHHDSRKHPGRGQPGRARLDGFKPGGELGVGIRGSMVIGLVRTRVGDSSATRVRAGGEVVGGSCTILATSCADGLAAGSSVVIPVSRSGQPWGRAGGTRGAVDIGRSADRLPRVPARAPAPAGSHHRLAAPRRTRRQHRFQRRRRFATCSESATRDEATTGPWFVAARSGSGATHTAVMMPVILG